MTWLLLRVSASKVGFATVSQILPYKVWLRFQAIDLQWALDFVVAHWG